MRAQQRSVEEELLAAFAATDSLAIFRDLPLVDQEYFFRWIEKAPDAESRWRRTDALVLAMRISCLRLDGHIDLASDSVRSFRSGSEQQPAHRTPEASVLIDELRDPEFFEILELVIDEFLRAREDSSVQETLAISETFLVALREAECLNLFRLLPLSDQSRFLRWIGSTSAPELRQKRTRTFIDALQASPIGEREHEPSPLVRSASGRGGSRRRPS